MALEDDLQKLLAKRQEIDAALLQRHGAWLAILFTDIVGSTAFFEQRGDIEGLALVKRHNALLMPLVESHQGRVVKTIGDSIMAVFEDPLAASRCGAEMMRTLRRETWSSADPIHIRIGVHWGQVLKDGGDVFGDAVNTAARINSAAAPDELLVSEDLHQALPLGHGLLAQPRAVSAKGKSAPVPVVALGWQDSGTQLAQEVFVLELSLAPDGLRVAAIDGAAQKGTVKSYSHVPLQRAELDAAADAFAALAQNGGQPAYVQSLQEQGSALLHRVLPEAVRSRLQGTKVEVLRLQLDDALTHVPWELCFDGVSHLGLRFATGRLVAAKDAAAEAAPATTAASERVLVVSNPSGDLPSATEEGRLVARLLESIYPGKVELCDGPLRRERFIQLVAGARVVHFAGHVRKGAEARPGGFVLQDGLVTAADLRPALAASVPALVFANGCHASTSGRWGEAASLAEALLVSGVRHVLAPLYSVPDRDALSFALRFYEAVLAGRSVGDGVRRARAALEESAVGALSWAGYVLYGEPRTTLVEPRSGLGDSGPTRAAGALSGQHPAVRRAAAVDAAAVAKGPWVVGALLLFVALGFAGVWSLRKANPDAGKHREQATGTVPAAPVPAPAKARREGPVRLSVLEFKSSAEKGELSFLNGGVAESLVTGLAGGELELVERTQLEADLNELQFSQTAYVDPQTRAALGRVKGAEVVLIGGWQASGTRLRLTARFIDVETGQVLATVLTDGDTHDPLTAQDRLTEAARGKLAEVKGKLRP